MGWIHGELGKMPFCVGTNPKRDLSSLLAQLQIPYN